MRAPERRHFEGRFVDLRPLEPARDAEVLWPLTHGDPGREAVWAYLPYGPFPSRDALLAQFATWARGADPHFVTVVKKATGQPVGVASLMSIRPEIRTIEIGHIWFVPEAQRTAANTEMAYLLLREAFEALGYRRMEWKCDSLNARSRRAALRLGFTFEGVFRQHMLIKGRNRDTAWFSVIDSEWPAVRAGLEGRLYGALETDANLRPIQWRVHLRSSPEAVFRMLSTAEGRKRFWASSAEEADGKVDFRFVGGERWPGTILEATAPRLFRLTYHGGSTVTFRLAPDGTGGTELELTETGVGAADWQDNHAGWVSVLLSLKAAADFAVDLRNSDDQRTWRHGYVDV
jgi:RimJ/RimL family protein N-acetyltransferase/uncharacterized protein YndB with AHSA1/START domain